MAKVECSIAVDPGSDLARAIEQARSAATAIVFQVDGQSFRFVPEEREDIWAGYDPGRARAALHRAAGGWADLDIDAEIDQLYKAREAGSWPLSQS